MWLSKTGTAPTSNCFIMFAASDILSVADIALTSVVIISFIFKVIILSIVLFKKVI
jgi:hypothetical protein